MPNIMIESGILFVLVTMEQISGVYFANHIVKARVIAVGNDSVALLLEFFKVVYDFTAEEGGFIL